MSPDRFKAVLFEHGEIYAFQAILLTSKPVIFEQQSDYTAWKRSIADAAKIRDHQVFLMGSAVTGFSMAPLKFGRVFSIVATPERPASDLDLVVVDSQLFHQCWAAILHRDRRAGLGMPSEQKEKLMQDVYYGFVSDKVTPRSAEVFRRLLTLRAACGRHRGSGGIRLNMRVYHRVADFAGYQISSLRSLKRTLEPTPK
jgi:hypothetical protein